MFNESKNLSNISQTSDVLSSNSTNNTNSGLVRYSKTNKLITALYMVTDIMDTAEPIRLRLRTLGLEILSDMHSINKINTLNKVEEAMSFLGLASALNMISEMNKNILFREFTELKNSLIVPEEKALSLESFFGENEFLPPLRQGEDRGGVNIQHPLPTSLGSGGLVKGEGNKIPYGHQKTNFGMQKGHTLMKAISEMKHPVRLPKVEVKKESFDMLKKERRFEIVRIIKDIKNATVKDIKDNARGALISCGEKTLQRELVAMVHDGVLKKMGEKRWSKYSL